MEPPLCQQADNETIWPAKATPKRKKSQNVDKTSNKSKLFRVDSDLSEEV
jgi:hypothetical protein